MKYLGNILPKFRQGLCRFGKFLKTIGQNFCRFWQDKAGVLGKFVFAQLDEATLAQILEGKLFATRASVL